MKILRTWMVGLTLSLSTLTLPACSTLQGVGTVATSSIVDEGLEAATRSLITAENAFTAAALTAAAAARQGLIPDVLKPRILEAARLGQTALEAAHHANSAADILRHVAEVRRSTETLSLARAHTS